MLAEKTQDALLTRLLQYQTEKLMLIDALLKEINFLQNCVLKCLAETGSEVLLLYASSCVFTEGLFALITF